MISPESNKSFGMPLSVLITGSTGAIGPRVVNVLHHAGCKVGAFSFDAPESGMFPRNVEVVIGDITNKAAVA